MEQWPSGEEGEAKAEAEASQRAVGGEPGQICAHQSAPRPELAPPITHLGLAVGLKWEGRALVGLVLSHLSITEPGTSFSITRERRRESWWTAAVPKFLHVSWFGRGVTSTLPITHSSFLEIHNVLVSSGLQMLSPLCLFTFSPRPQPTHLPTGEFLHMLQ
jgi:hypothetical protein